MKLVIELKKRLRYKLAHKNDFYKCNHIVKHFFTIYKGITLD